MKVFDFVRLMRLNQPTGIWLLFLPCLLGIGLNMKIYQIKLDLSLLKIIVYFFIGSVLMRSAGCIINDLFDKNFDRKVLRTKNRPLANNRISSFQALILLAMLLFLSLYILLQFNFLTILGGFISVILIFTYPLMKRFFNLPQLYLGITFNFGVLMSSLAVVNKINGSTILLYVLCIMWTLIYDTIYGFQDIEDDLRIGLKSSAITINKFFKKPKIILFILNFLIFLTLIFIGLNHNFKFGFYSLSFLACGFIGFGVLFCNLKNPNNCLKFFKQNVFFGWLILIAILSA
jgi:4-hydroxybenzoate polyprenyl transferase